MAEKVKLSAIRAQFPMYADVPTPQLLGALHAKHYSDLPRDKFLQAIDYDTERQDPTADMSGFGKFVAGYGSAVPRLVRGIGQRLGINSQEEVDYANQLDAPLMQTGAGTAGNIAGNIGAAIPTAFIPGAASIPGAAAIGAVQGFIAPTSTGESVLNNALIGGAAGAGGIVAGRGLNSLYRGARSLVEPFTQRGREAIGGRVLEQFGVGARDVAGMSGAPSMTGARATLAEAIPDATAAAGAARLQGGLRAVDPRFSAALTAREGENNAARVASLEGIASTRDAAATARGAAAEPLYKAAFDNTSALTPSQLKAQSNLLKSGRIEKLMQSPAIQDAMAAARTNAENAGRTFDSSGSIEGLHNMKLAIDDMIRDPTTAAQTVRVDALRQARDRLVNVIETLSPTYRDARTTYAAASRPVNQADIAGQVLESGRAPTSDLGGAPRLMPNKLLTALGDEGRLMKRATGRNLGDDLGAVMEPNQLATIRAVGGEVDRASAVARAENGPGSATAQRLASQNVLRQVLGPTGLPESWAESTMLNTLMRPVQFGYNQVAEPRIQQVIAEALLDPSRAAALLQQARAGQIRIPDNLVTQLTAAAARLSAPSAVTNRPQ